MEHRNSLVAAVLLAAAMAAGAASPDVMRESEVSVDALVGALTPEPVGKTRQITIRRAGDKPASASTAAPAASSTRRPSAAVLVTFDTSSAQLTPQARKALDTVGKALGSERLASYRFAVEGHADRRGNPEANVKLSEQRAESVKRYLVEQAGIAADRLDAVGKGDQEPLNRQDPAAPENRRVTFVTMTE